tara:strand:- start:367 stop:1062 length:696 start_codon:yes stop_codon:yes gene_type:complete
MAEQKSDKPEKTKAPARRAPAKKKKTTVRKKAPAKKKTVAKKPAAKKAPAKPAEFNGDTSIRHLAKLLGYNDKSIRTQIENNGGPVKTQGGNKRAAVVNVGEWHRHFLSQALGEGNKLSDTKLAKEQENLRKQKRENDLAEGKVVQIDEVNFFFQSMLVLLSTRLEGISGKAAGGDPALRIRIQDETRHTQLEIFNAVVEFLRPHVGDSAADLATAQASKLGMGAREKDSS